MTSTRSDIEILNTSLAAEHFGIAAYEAAIRSGLLSDAVASVARAFQLGRLESEAVFNLRCKVPRVVVNILSEAVKRRGLSKLMTHELLAKDVLNQHYTSGFGPLEQWREELRNRENNELAPHLILFITYFFSSLPKPNVHYVPNLSFVLLSCVNH